MTLLTTAIHKEPVKGLIIAVLIGALILFIAFGNSRIPKPVPSSTPQPTSFLSVGKNASPVLRARSTVTAMMVTPARGESWTLGSFHTIRWSHAGGYSGAIALLDAPLKTVIGWITSLLASQQVMYDWDTALVALSRTNPLKKNIVSGTYIIKVVFDGPRPSIESAPLAIIETGSETILTHEVTIQDNTFSPDILAIKQSERLAILEKSVD